MHNSGKTIVTDSNNHRRTKCFRWFLDHLDIVPPVTSLSCLQWRGTNSNSLEYISWSPFGLDFTASSFITWEQHRPSDFIPENSQFDCCCKEDVYLIHVRFDENLSHQSFSVSSLVDGGVRPQAVTHHVHVGRLQALDQQTLKRLLQHGGDPCNTLSEQIRHGGGFFLRQIKLLLDGFTLLISTTAAYWSDFIQKGHSFALHSMELELVEFCGDPFQNLTC